MGSTLPTNVLQLNAPHLGITIPFTYFQNSHEHIVRILKGDTYPLVEGLGTVTSIVDIGANVGAATVMLALRYPDAVVHSFEPGPTPYELLSRNAAAIPRVQLHPYGLADSDRECKLYRSTWDPMSASVLSSAENTGDFDTIRLRKASQALREEAISSIDILKVDTEGCEVPVLADLAELAKAARVIYLEYHSDADRRRIDAMLEPSHVLAHAAARQPHRGDVCYVHRSTPYATAMAALAIHR